MPNHDLVIKGGRLVIPRTGVTVADVGISGGVIAEISKDIPLQQAARVIDASGKFVFPGAIDSHFHIGIYRPMKEDAESESRSAVSGGITTILSFFRTGKNYLNKIGPFKEIFPEVLELSKGSYLTDYSYHLAIMTRQQLGEIEWLVTEAGVSQFKYYMFYRTLDLAGSDRGDSYLMIKEPIDLGFLYELMEGVAKANEKFSDYGTIRLAVHCEEPEIITACTRRVIESGSSGNLARDYSEARPSWSERVSIHEVGAIAYETGCPINLVHLTSQEAVDATNEVAYLYPDLNILNEATLHHLTLSVDNRDYGVLGKVNPPIRGSDDVEYLWQSVLAGDIITAVSDHACLPRELKKGDLWTALPGFAGTSLIFPVLITEGYYKRGLVLERIAELAALNPSIGHNLYPQKGTIMIGGDADLAIVDINKERKVSTDILYSAQDYTPFEGLSLKGWVDTTILRGEVVFEDGAIIGRPGYGKHLKTPVKLHYK